MDANLPMEKPQLINVVKSTATVLPKPAPQVVNLCLIKY